MTTAKVPLELLTRDTLISLGEYLDAPKLVEEGTPPITDDARVLMDFLLERGICPRQGMAPIAWRNPPNPMTYMVEVFSHNSRLDGRDKNPLPYSAYRLLWVLGPWLP